jgi:hypothetical protein
LFLTSNFHLTFKQLSFGGGGGRGTSQSSARVRRPRHDECAVPSFSTEFLCHDDIGQSGVRSYYFVLFIYLEQDEICFATGHSLLTTSRYTILLEEIGGGDDDHDDG